MLNCPYVGTAPYCECLRVAVNVYLEVAYGVHAYMQVYTCIYAMYERIRMRSATFHATQG